ncbi:hypothetical protein BRAO285_2190016 [Bradyrhizobium sp. ORS 285]|nr:hypothetical protein BRAO285_2190016 [Bradyrhizobium sp. ORS 285]
MKHGGAKFNLTGYALPLPGTAWKRKAAPSR